MDKKRIGYYDYTVILTYLGLLFACCGIFQVMSKQYWLAVFCLMAAGVCDMFDGTVAKTKERDDGEKCFGIQIDSLSDLVSFGALPALFVYNISGGHPAVGIISALYILAALIRLAYFNVLEQQRQRETPDRKSSFLGVPVTTIAVLLPLVYVIYDYHLLHSRVIFSLMLIVTGAGFLTPVTIKKPDALGKLALIVVGVAEAAGRYLLKLLVRPTVSRAAAKFLSCPLSRPMTGYYIRKYGIDLTGCEKTKFDSFNDFFTRRKQIDIHAAEDSVISPCDGFLSIYSITPDRKLDIKHSSYTVSSLLEDESLAEKYGGGLCLIFRLEPRHYHRYLYAASGVIKNQKVIGGVLHCVRPIACREFPVYVQNSREYTVTESRNLGSVVQMEIGALLVGKIRNREHLPDFYVTRGSEKGYFEFGGSTIVLMFEADRIEPMPWLSRFTDSGREIPVTIGQTIGRIIHFDEV